ncbi:class I SAM-dependent methyltransferase [Pelobacter propionicus]|uniref:class I SAM-dependent methyltransferase n=1 Tax=Pelobacter propionicus TaxID=29543 RepID=UPI0018DDC734|nr:class I SAM-dependent methyltransferase [Pelobacter propionicus]
MRLKKVLKMALINKLTASQLIRPVLRLHSYCYRLSSELAIIISKEGLHPKHSILEYESWFYNHVETSWTVLDVGSNTGIMAHLLAGKVAKVYGIELQQSLVEEAKKTFQLPNIEYFCADATCFFYQELQPIDCVVLSNVLEHIKNRSYFLHKLLTELPWRKPYEKRFLIRVPLITREWIVMYKKRLGLEYRLDDTHYIEYTQEQFAQELGECNIRVVNLDIRYGEIYAICMSD